MLAAAAPRYAVVAAQAGVPFPAGAGAAFDVVERLPGSATTDFGAPVVEKGWPPRYAARRIAWHVLDHAWQIEDRSGPPPA